MAADQGAAASKIQEWARRAATKKNAAVKLQAFARYMSAKNEVTAVRLQTRADCEKNAAVKLQAFARYMSAKKVADAEVNPSSSTQQEVPSIIVEEASDDTSLLGSTADSFEEESVGNEKEVNSSYNDGTIQGYIDEARKNLKTTKEVVAGITDAISSEDLPTSSAKANGEHFHLSCSAVLL